MKNIHLLPTKKPSRLYKSKITQNIFISNIISQYGDATYNQNIYITSDEEIKEGDWYLVELFKITGESDGFHIEKCTKLDDVWCNNFDVISTRHRDNCKKIILTIDQDLIADGVQSIDDEFLEWFVKNPSCEFVSVQKRYSDFTVEPFIGYKIIIPQEEPKQETLEEAANRLFYTVGNEGISSIDSFMKGANYQSERMYSEVFEWLSSKDYLSDKMEFIQKEFEQFKKK
jgi:hypothetical protein